MGKYRTKKQIWNDVENIVLNRGGRIIEIPLNFTTKSKINLECKNGHKFSPTINSVLCNKWCKQCFDNRISIIDAQNIASQRGGFCLTKTYISSKSKLLWKCQFNHTWETSYDCIKKTWCPYCCTSLSEEICRTYLETIFQKKFPKLRPKWLLSPKERPMEIDGYCKEIGFAFEHNGHHHYHSKCYGTNISNTVQIYDTIKLCKLNKMGIKLLVINQLFINTKIDDLYDLIKEFCVNNDIRFPNKHPNININTVYGNTYLSKYIDLANSKNGKIFPETYINTSTKCKWQCKNGHVWNATPNSINNGSWCPFCRKLNIDIAKQIAKERCGICLSDNYINKRQKLKWKCLKCGHIWFASLGNVKNKGTWCPNCRKN